MASYLNQQFCAAPQNCFATPVKNKGQRAVDYAKEHKATFLGLALAQVTLGLFCLGLGISSLPLCVDDLCTYYYPYGNHYDAYGGLTMASAGIWGGVLVIVFGFFGIAQACFPTACKVTTNLTLSIFGFLTAAAMMGVEIAAATVSLNNIALVIIHSLIASFSFIIFILFIVSTSYAGTANCSSSCGECCCGGCYCDDDTRYQAMFNGTPSQLITLSNGQTVLMQGAHQVNSQLVASPTVVNSPPEYSIAAPSDQVSFSVAAGPSHGLANHGFQGDGPNKV